MYLRSNSCRVYTSVVIAESMRVLPPIRSQHRPRGTAPFSKSSIYIYMHRGPSRWSWGGSPYVNPLFDTRGWLQGSLSPRKSSDVHRRHQNQRLDISCCPYHTTPAFASKAQEAHLLPLKNLPRTPWYSPLPPGTPVANNDE